MISTSFGGREACQIDQSVLSVQPPIVRLDLAHSSSHEYHYGKRELEPSAILHILMVESGHKGDLR